jgi:hypothetical protein
MQNLTVVSMAFMFCCKHPLPLRLSGHVIATANVLFSVGRSDSLVAQALHGKSALELNVQTYLVPTDADCGR